MYLSEKLLYIGPSKATTNNNKQAKKKRVSRKISSPFDERKTYRVKILRFNFRLE